MLLTRVEAKLHYKHFMVKSLLQFFQSVKSRVHGCTSHLADECGLELGSSIAGVKKLGEGHLQKEEETVDSVLQTLTMQSRITVAPK